VRQVADCEAVSIRQDTVAANEIEWPRAKKRHGGSCVDRRRDAMIAGYEDLLDQRQKLPVIFHKQDVGDRLSPANCSPSRHCTVERHAR